jgi:heterodisulfide reductase subunit C
MGKIAIEKLDPGFGSEIAAKPGGENIRKCFACGTCTAGCPVFQVESEYNPRRLIRMILLGMREEVLSSKLIWLCSRCYTCTANCPQEVDFSNIMMALRDMAVAGGFADADLGGRLDAISEAANALRADCINMVLGAEGAGEAEVRKSADALLSRTLEDARRKGGRTA